MTLKFRVERRGSFKSLADDIREPIATAATAAVRQASEIAKRDGRASIASAGFSAKWQKALQDKVFPEQGTSMSPAAVIFHKIPYANVFEDGAIIAGKPTLYLPITGAPLPTARGGRKMTPKLYVQQVGPLVPIKRPGRPTLLAGKGKGTKGKVVPLFFGISTVSINQKFKIVEAVRRAAARLGEFYVRNFRT